jgi:FkbM family methyltransferase
MSLRKNATLLREYTAHQLLGTPLEQPAKFFNSLPTFWNRLNHPELQEVFSESALMDQLMEQVINNRTNCIDIGCHIGSMMQKMQDLSPNGHHIAIEPIPYKVKWLKQKFAKVDVHQVALSDRTGETSFYIQTEQTGYSGLRQHAKSERERVGYEELKVECKRLEQLVPSDRPIGFIKLDVEGAELEVFRGSEAVLRQDHPVILFECTQSGLDSYGTDSSQIHEILQRFGYQIFLLKDYLGGGQALTAEAFSAAMVYPFKAFNFVAA